MSKARASRSASIRKDRICVPSMRCSMRKSCLWYPGARLALFVDHARVSVHGTGVLRFADPGSGFVLRAALCDARAYEDGAPACYERYRVGCIVHLEMSLGMSRLPRTRRKARAGGRGRCAPCALGSAVPPGGFREISVSTIAPPLRLRGVIARFVRRITLRNRNTSMSTSTHRLGDSVSRCPAYCELFSGSSG